MVKKIPIRTCIVTHERLEKKDLIRIVRTPTGNVIVDETYKANGRGAYLKKDKEVFLKAKKSKVLERSLNVKIEDDLYLELEKYFD